MSGVGEYLGGVSTYRAVVAAVMCLLVGAVGLFLDEPVTPVLAAIYVLLVVYFVAVAFDRVRKHSAFNLLSLVWTVLVFVLLYLSAAENSPLLLALAVLAALGVPVEVYNYRYGTSYLRIDW